MSEKILKTTELTIGSKHQGYMLVQSIVERKSVKGTACYIWCDVELTDGNNSVKAKYWGVNKETIEFMPKTVVWVEVSVEEYNGAPSYVITQCCVHSYEQSGLMPADFAKKAPMPSEDMFEEIKEILNRAVNGNMSGSLSELVINIFENNKEAILKSSAAASIHHDMWGGLLWHSLRMARLAEVMVSIYPSLDREVLVAAAVCHDVGKIVELETDALGIATYSIDGQLFGHAHIGMRMVEEEAKRGSYNSEKVRCLCHCIASHHGKLEWGAVALPRILEASVLHYIDLIDSRVQQFETQYETMEPGTCSDNKVFGLDNVKVYKPEFPQNDTTK